MKFEFAPEIRVRSVIEIIRDLDLSHIAAVIVSAIGLIGFGYTFSQYTNDWKVNELKNEIINLKNQDNSRKQRNPEMEKTEFLKSYVMNNNGDDILTDLCLDAFECSEDGTRQSYYILIELLSKTVNKNSKSDHILKLIKSIADHPNTYELQNFVRVSDPGFYRHYIVAFLFYHLALMYDRENPISEKTKTNALIFYCRFFGNINSEKWKMNCFYSDKIKTAKRESGQLILQLSNELLKKDNPNLQKINEYVANDNFNGVLEIYENFRAGDIKFNTITAKSDIFNDSEWIN